MESMKKMKSIVDSISPMSIKSFNILYDHLEYETYNKEDIQLV